MKSFGSLLKRLRADEPLSLLVDRLGVPKSYIVNLEAGRKKPTEKQARRILKVGFGLTEDEASRCILHVLLFDYGVHDEPVRDILIEVIEQAKTQANPGDWLDGLLTRLEGAAHDRSVAGERE